MKSRGPYRRRSTPFKFQLCGISETGSSDAVMHSAPMAFRPTFIHLWLTQFDRGEPNDEDAEASVIAEYKAHLAALKRKVGQLRWSYT